MAWPATSLDVEVSLALGADLSADPTGWSWTTLPGKVYDRDPVRISRGRPDEQTHAQPSQCLVMLDNRDGRFSPRNPTGVYYGQIGRNTPIRVRVNPGSGYVTRFVGYVSEWPQRWDPSEKDFWVPVHADGILRRLGQGATPLKSALYRAIVDSGPVAYWPMEDLSRSTSAASGLTGGSPLRVYAGTVDFAASEPPPGSEPTPNLSASGRLTGPAPGGSSTTWTVEFAAKCALSLTAVIIELGTSGGSLSYWRILPQFDESLGVEVQAVQATGGLVSVLTVPSLPDYDGVWHHYRLKATQNGGNIDASMWIDGDLTTGTASSETLGRVTDVIVNSDHTAVSATITGSVGHAAVYDGAMSADHTDAFNGYDGELAGARFTRLSGEESVTASVVGGDTQAMGAQTTAALPDLLRECEVASAGPITERLTGKLGLDLVDSRYNQAVALTLDYSQRHIAPALEPTDDDLLTRNDVTVIRLDGSSARVVDVTGPMGTDTVGRYDEQLSVNLSTDEQCEDHASWRVHLGTVDELRWPRVMLDLRRNSSLVSAWLAADVGSLVRLSNLPDSISYDDVDLILEGYAEGFDSKTWMVELNCAPGRPYQVAIVSDTAADQDIPRVGSGTATLGTGIDSDDTSLSVSTGTDGLWTTAAGDFSMDINIGGERIRLSGIAGGSSPQTFTASARSVNGVVKSHSAGAVVKPWRTATVGL